MEDNPPTAAFVAVMNEQVVAVVDLSRKGASTDAIDWYKANYDIEAYVPFERHRARAQAVLTDMVVNPIFGTFGRYVLKEAMRLYEKTLLYHEASSSDVVPLHVLETLVPVPARWRATPNPGDELLGRKRGDEVPGGTLLHYFARRLASDPRCEVNARIVVVGLSTCAVGMLKALLLSSTANVKRVTLISEPGISRASGVVVDEDYPEPFEFEALGLGQRLRVIKARAVAVDAEAKVVQLPDGALVPYDILVLAHGLQESAQRDLVTKAGKDLLPDASDLADWNSPEVDIVAELTKAPSDMEEEATDLTGFVSLSSDNASDELADAVSKLGDGSVVIVGGGLDALAAARRLLDLGVAASSIKIACENDQLEPLGDQVIDRVVAQSLDVAVEYGLKFAELVRDNGALSAARFARPVQPDDAPAPAPPQEDDVEAWVERPATPPPEVVDLKCGLVVGASTPAVAADAAGLMEYPLTVDAAFKTCDDSIYAAGRHVAGQERFNSLELGACLAQSLLARLTDSSVEAPDFRKARAVSATLPGGLFYCRAALPTVPLDATALPTGMLGNDEARGPCPLSFAFVVATPSVLLFRLRERAHG